MGQLSFAEAEYSNRRRKPKVEVFLDKMDEIIPWQDWVDMVKPCYYSNTRGRKAKDIETMLRMYLMQNWFNLSDEMTEEAIYTVYPMKKFLRLDFSIESAPDATTLTKFRHIIERNSIGEKIFADVRDRLDKAGLMMHGGSILDATIIEAPTSIKNREGKRDPEMHQTQKGKQWHHGMKVHAGVDAGTGYVHTITGTPANVNDIVESSNLIREDDEVVYGDSGYQGIQNRPEIKNDPNFKGIDYRINKRPSTLKATGDKQVGLFLDKQIEHRKSAVRCKVEHAFLIVKRQFGYAKVVYRGIAKNMNRFNILFASANLVMCFRAGRQNEFIRA